MAMGNSPFIVDIPSYKPPLTVDFPRFPHGFPTKNIHLQFSSTQTEPFCSTKFIPSPQFQWPFQEPSTYHIFWAYVLGLNFRGYPHNSYGLKNMVLT